MNNTISKLAILFLLFTGLAFADGLNDQQYAVEMVGGNWVSSSGASVFVGATQATGGITISVNGGRAIQGYIGTEPTGEIYFTYTSSDGATMNAEYNSDGDVIYVKSLDSSFTSMWRRR